MSVVNPAEPIDYTKFETPSSYRCGECGATGVKLWRDYNTPLKYQTLLCMACACNEQGMACTPTEDGTSFYTGEVRCWARTARTQPGHWFGYDPEVGPPDDTVETWVEHVTSDQIGWRVPAVPIEDNDTFWGYTSVPDDGRRWWYNLPARAEKAA